MEEAQVAQETQVDFSSGDNGADTVNQDQSTQDQVVQDVFDWSKYGIDTKADKRFGTMWKSPADLFNAYKNSEQEWNKFKPQLNDYQKKNQEYEKSISEYRRAEEYLNSILQHPQMGVQFQQLLDQYEKAQKASKYGENVPDHVIEKLQRLDQLEARFNQQEEQTRISETSKQIDTALNEIADFAKQNNIKYDQREFLEYCKANEIPANPTVLNAVFKSVAMGKILEMNTAKTQQDVLGNIQNNKVNSANSSTRVMNRSGTPQFATMTDEIIAKLTGS